MDSNVFQLQYAMDTFYFLMCGVLVMWMAAGFTMLESGLVRAKNTTEILTKNVALYSVACIMYMAQQTQPQCLPTLPAVKAVLKAVPSTLLRQTSSSKSCLWRRLCPLSPVPSPNA